MKYALVTGSTKGIGKQIALDLMREGYFVYFNYRKDDTTAADTMREALQISEYCSLIKGKVMAESKELPVLDVLVLNVGITNRTPFSELTQEEWNQVFETNLTMPIFLIQSLLPRFSDTGKIIFISSISGIVPDSVSIPYGVSKAGINMLVQYLAKELAPRHITVNAIAPGYTMTSWHQQKLPDQIHRIADKTLAKRFATVEEISQAVQMVIKNDYINGQIIRVDGGFGL